MNYLNPPEPILVDRIQNGIAFLDRQDPTILDRIDLNLLDLSSSCNCILGQVGHIVDARMVGDDDLFDEPVATFDEFVSSEGPDYYNDSAQPFFMSSIEAAEYGFFLGAVGIECEQSDYNRLTEMWAEALIARKEERNERSRQEGTSPGRA